MWRVSSCSVRRSPTSTHRLSCNTNSSGRSVTSQSSEYTELTGVQEIWIKLRHDFTECSRIQCYWSNDGLRPRTGSRRESTTNLNHHPQEALFAPRNNTVVWRLQLCTVAAHTGSGPSKCSWLAEETVWMERLAVRERVQQQTSEPTETVEVMTLVLCELQQHTAGQTVYAPPFRESSSRW